MHFTVIKWKRSNPFLEMRQYRIAHKAAMAHANMLTDEKRQTARAGSIKSAKYTPRHAGHEISNQNSEV